MELQVDADRFERTFEEYSFTRTEDCLAGADVFANATYSLAMDP